MKSEIVRCFVPHLLLPLLAGVAAPLRRRCACPSGPQRTAANMACQWENPRPDIPTQMVRALSSCKPRLQKASNTLSSRLARPRSKAKTARQPAQPSLPPQARGVRARPIYSRHLPILAASRPTARRSSSRRRPTSDRLGRLARRCMLPIVPSYPALPFAVSDDVIPWS